MPASRQQEHLNQSISAPEPNHRSDNYSPWPQLSHAMIVNSKKPGYAVTLCIASILMNLSLLPPEQAAELLLWYMQWSRDLAAEMHQRCLVRNEARRTVISPISHRPCDCVAEWRCEPHNACFIHDSCFCPGSGSFPPVKPPRS